MRRSGLKRIVLSVILSVGISAAGPVFQAAAVSPTDQSLLDRRTLYYSVSDTQHKTPLGEISVRDYPELIRKVANGCMEYKNKIDVSEYGLPYEAAAAINTVVCSAYPDLFYIDDSLVSCIPDSDGKLLYVCPYYLNPDGRSNDPDIDYIKAKQKEFYAEADKYLARVNDEASNCRDEFSKALFLHDELVLDTYYDINSGSNYTYLVEKHGLCRSYARVYAYLLSQLGIKSETIYSADMNHVWMKICLDGKYYHIDITWDDPVPDSSGRAKHEYYLLSDGAIDDHYDYVQLNPSGDNKYDNYLIHNYNTKLCKTSPDGTYVYGVDNTSKKLVRYNYATNKEDTVIDLKDYNWKASSGSQVWTNSHSGLDTYGNILYFNTPYEVIRYYPELGKSQVVKSYDKNGSRQVFGVRIRDGKLYAYVGQYKSTETTEELIGDISGYVYDSKSALSGDVNMDNGVDIGDALLIARYDAGLADLSSAQLSVGDVTSDGSTDIADALKIAKYDAGIIESV